MGLKKLYLDIYEQFAKKYDTVKGYNFQEDHRGSTSPKMVTFKDRIKWWTLDRPKRLRMIKQERDQQQQDKPLRHHRRPHWRMDTLGC